VRTGRFASLSNGTIAARLKRWIRVRKSRIKGERKGYRNQLSEYLRHGDSNCSAQYVSNCFLRRFTVLNHDQIFLHRVVYQLYFFLLFVNMPVFIECKFLNLLIV
jgi:hypothetical protein